MQLGRASLFVLLRYAFSLEPRADTICSNRMQPESILDDLVSRSPVYLLDNSRARAVGYDNKRHQGFQGNDQGRRHHDYFFTYERLFYGLPHHLTMVNVGILDGHSLINYADFFGPRATIVGTDISTQLWESNNSTRSNVQVYEGDSTHAALWVDLSRRFPTGVQLVVDDGCHSPKCVEATLKSAWPLISPGGLYIAEDTTPLPFIRSLMMQIQGKRKGSAARNRAFRRANGTLSAATVETVTFGDGFFALSKYNPH